MKHYKSLIFVILFLLAPLRTLAETIPLMIPHTGTIKVNNVPFNGMGQFKFAITNGHPECSTIPILGAQCKFYWTHDNIAPNGTKEPENFVKILVNNGIFAVRLGDTTLTDMQAIPTTVFENAATSLRVWFNDGVKGSQWLSPDRPLAAVPYAYHAETAKNVVNGGVTSTMIANDAVTTTQIADGTITGTDIAGGTITTGNLNFDPATQDELNSHKGSGDHNGRYLQNSGGTMTGAINLPANGLAVGSDQLVVSGGNVGLGTTAPQAKLHVVGDIKVDGSRIIRKSVVQVDTANYSAATSWTLGPSFPIIPNFKAGSLVKLTYHIPMRNDSNSWGGGYIEPQISFNGGINWNSLGSSGYDGGVMNYGSGAIGSYFNSLLIDPNQGSNFSVAVRFYFKSYDGTVLINQSHDINIVSGTATIMAGVNGQQHFAKIIVEELY